MKDKRPIRSTTMCNRNLTLMMFAFITRTNGHECVSFRNEGVDGFDLSNFKFCWEQRVESALHPTYLEAMDPNLARVDKGIQVSGIKIEIVQTFILLSSPRPSVAVMRFQGNSSVDNESIHSVSMISSLYSNVSSIDIIIFSYIYFYYVHSYLIIVMFNYTQLCLIIRNRMYLRKRECLDSIRSGAHHG